MRFKKFLRKINRGVVLFLALLIGFSIFVVTSTLQFKNEKEEVINFCKDFCSDYASLYIMNESDFAANEKLNDTQLGVINNKVNAFMDNWTLEEKIDSLDYYSDYSEFKTDISESLKYNYTERSYVKDMICAMQDNITVKKVSDNIVFAMFECEYTVKHTNRVKLVLDSFYPEIYPGYGQTVFYLRADNNYYSEVDDKTYTENQIKEILKEEEDSKTRTSVKLNYMMYLKKTDEGWKTIYLETSSYDLMTLPE